MRNCFRLVAFVLLLALLVSCGGGGGGGGSSATAPAGPSTVARFVSSMDANFVLSFNSGSQAVGTVSVYGITIDRDYLTWSFQSGNFTNGVINFSGEQNPTITITNSTFNYKDDGGSNEVIPFTKTTDNGSTAVFNGTWVSGSSFIIDFKSDNTYTLAGEGALADISGTGTYSITSGDFSNGTGLIDGEAFTVTNGSSTLVVPVEDINGGPANMTITFVKQ